MMDRKQARLPSRRSSGETGGIPTFSIGFLCAGVVAVATAVAAVAPLAAQDASTSASRSGEELFISECGMCHIEGGTGTFMLERRLGASKALLAQRTDLPPRYVEFVVRNGLNGMPPMNRVEVSDEELAKIAGYLVREGRDRR